MKLANLFELIQKTLSVSGFKPVPFFRNSYAESYWVLGDELEKRKLGDWEIEAIFGMCACVRIVPHGNQADENTSYYLESQLWERSSKKKIERIKVSMRSSERYAIAQITEFAEGYVRALTEKRVEDLLR